MAVPLAVALPAVAASLAYLNARTQFSQDCLLAYAGARATIGATRAQKEQRLNRFYTLEEYALDTKTAHRSLIAIPPTIPADYTEESIKRLRCEEWTYKEVYDQVLKYAQWLKEEHDVGKGDVVALNCKNKPLFIFLWYALWSLGARPAFINTALNGQSLLHCVKTSSARLLLLDSELENVLTPDFVRDLQAVMVGDSPVNVVVVGDLVQRRVQAMSGFRAANAERDLPDGPTMALLIFTSGTTGLPKPATVSFSRFHGATSIGRHFLSLGRDDRYYTALPLYHSSAAMLAFGAGLANGSTVVISPRFSPRTFFASVAVSRATTIQYIGEMCRYLVSTPTSPFDRKHGVKRAFGNGMRPDVWAKFKDRFAIDEIIEFYGATESPASTLNKSRNRFHQGAIGRVGTLLQLTQRKQLVLIRHDMDTGEPWRDPSTGLCARSPPNEPGELLAQLDPDAISDKFQGYWGNEAATASKILRDVLTRGDAYFRTGDLMTTDRDGHTYFVDRVGDSFRWKAENVSTSELERVLGAHPAIAEANVYGVQLPAHDGRAGCAALVFASTSADKAGDVSIPDEATLSSIAEHVTARLPRYARPLFLRAVTQFETTGTAKYTKHGLRTQGVDPGLVTDGDRLFWLHPRHGTYVVFGQDEWQGLVSGKTKL